METAIEIIKIVAPTLATVVAIYFILKSQHQKEIKILGLKLKEQEKLMLKDTTKPSHELVLPMRLKAYEEMAQLLERIEPSSIVMRIHKPGMSAKLLHADLLRGIREEFESKVSQQIYVSSNSWELIKQAKEETVKIINISFQKMPEDASGIDLSRDLFESMMQMGQSPSGIALSYIHQEVNKLID